MSTVKFPQVTVELSGQDGNGFFIIARTTKELRRASVSNEDIDAYREEAMSGDYDNLIQVTMKTVNVE